MTRLQQCFNTKAQIATLFKSFQLTLNSMLEAYLTISLPPSTKEGPILANETDGILSFFNFSS